MTPKPAVVVARDVISLLLLKGKRACDLSVVSLQLQLSRMVWVLQTKLLSVSLSVQLIFLTLVSKFDQRFRSNTF